MRAARYRAGQFWRYLRPAPLSAADRAEVRQALPPALSALFERLAAGEQAHSLTVLRAVLRAAPAAPPELRQAALLHDVGKSRAPLTLLDRVLVVAVTTLWPGRAAAWGQGAPIGLRRPFVTAARHPAWGAELAAQAGAPPLTVALIRRHQTPVSAPLTPEDEWLAVLQSADDDA
ncbi:MAG: HD domain-containing protein [Anaerolineales bacterium]|nr:HD domain-containing protein [Anaerolineales bacterium]